MKHRKGKYNVRLYNIQNQYIAKTYKPNSILDLIRYTKQDQHDTSCAHTIIFYLGVSPP